MNLFGYIIYGSFGQGSANTIVVWYMTYDTDIHKYSFEWEIRESSVRHDFNLRLFSKDMWGETQINRRPALIYISSRIYLG